jgi:hypothetical protein
MREQDILQPAEDTLGKVPKGQQGKVPEPNKAGAS